MGGEGSMASAILSLKQNRALLKKRKIKDIKELLYETSGKTELEFRKVSAIEMARIKAEIRKQAKKDRRVEFITYGVSALLVFVLIYFLYYWLS